MKIKDIIRANGSIKLLGDAKFGNGGLALYAKKTLRVYKDALQDYQELLEMGQKEVNETESKEAKEALVIEWNKKIEEASNQDVAVEFPRIFKLSELYPEGNPHGFDALSLESLDNLGIFLED